jgi:hypothetical protein
MLLLLQPHAALIHYLSLYGCGNDQIMVLLKKSGIRDRTVASQHKSVLQCAINGVRGEQDGVDVEVPGAHATTQGVSPRRDVD